MSGNVKPFQASTNAMTASAARPGAARGSVMPPKAPSAEQPSISADSSSSRGIRSK
jgi:hypothetical protein